MKVRVDISFVIPAKNESESLTQLVREIGSVMRSIKKSYEIIFVDDGSTDKTFEKIKSIRIKDKRVKAIQLRGNWGKSTALQIGFQKAQGNIIFTLDADLQDDPIEIPKFLKKLTEGYDLVTGWKEKRHDPISKTLPSKILNNFLIPTLTGVKLHDNNCGFKAYKKEVIENLNLYGELYRFIPILATKQNFKVAEISVHHRARKYGVSKFGWERNLKGFLDLITIFFLTGYLRRPAHFFGTLGILSFIPGFVIGIYITYIRLTTGSIQFRQPLLTLGILLMVVGVQLITTGLLAEMMTSFNAQQRNLDKLIKSKI